MNSKRSAAQSPPASCVVWRHRHRYNAAVSAAVAAGAWRQSLALLEELQEAETAAVFLCFLVRYGVIVFFF